MKLPNNAFRDDCTSKEKAFYFSCNELIGNKALFQDIYHISFFFIQTKQSQPRVTMGPLKSGKVRLFDKNKENIREVGMEK